jgi:hypothetical protein
VDVFDDVEKVIFIIPDPGDLACIGIDVYGQIIFHRAEGRERRVVLPIGHKLPAATGIAIRDDIQEGMPGSQGGLRILPQRIDRQGLFSGDHKIPFRMPGFRDLFLENEEAARDADDKHHQPGHESEPEVNLTDEIFKI